MSLDRKTNCTAPNDPSYVLNDFFKNSGVQFEKPNKLMDNKLLIDSLPKKYKVICANNNKYKVNLIVF